MFGAVRGNQSVIFKIAWLIRFKFQSLETDHSSHVPHPLPKLSNMSLAAFALPSTVQPGPLGPGSLRSSTSLVCPAPTSSIVPPAILPAEQLSLSTRSSIALATSSGVAHLSTEETLTMCSGA